MKTKKLGLISAIVLAIAFLFALNASAAWYNCTVIEAGPGANNYLVKLTDNGGAFTNRYFVLESSKKSAMLAVALTAATNTMNISVNLSSSNQWGTVLNMYLLP